MHNLYYYSRNFFTARGLVICDESDLIAKICKNILVIFGLDSTNDYIEIYYSLPDEKDEDDPFLLLGKMRDLVS